MKKETRIRELKGIGEKTEKLFEKLGVCTLEDVVRYYPRSYVVYESPVTIGDLEPGKTAAVKGTICGKVQVGGGKKMQVTMTRIRDDSGYLKVIWFRMPFLQKTLKTGMEVVVRGRVAEKKDGLEMEHPEIFYPAQKYEEKRNSMQPVYGLTSGLTNQTILKVVRQSLDVMEELPETLTAEIRETYGLEKLQTAIWNIHFPETKEQFISARKRLVFEEFLLFVLGVRQTKTQYERCRNPFPMKDMPQVEDFRRSLPYALTGAQQRVWEEIREELTGPYVMSRLVQGDVGSGKTILAVLALMLTGLNGLQGAMMAPTEVLARQHFAGISQMLRKYDVPLEAELLTGSMTAKEKREAYRRIAQGEVQIVIGTHALIQEKVEYQKLALVITDEQHRFGVRQREAFAGKGKMPHVLVMSATPIPRTLAIILYGDLDISIVDELPANRLPIKNCVVDTGYRGTAFRFMKSQIEMGHQCYVICPMVEESDAIEAENVTDYSERLSELMGETVLVRALHGKMKQEQKEEIMADFGAGRIQILVSTTVIEVGIDVPNATVMLVENAERFGLAQLHQLRGRVGRGASQSYCIFMTASKAKDTRERLEILGKSNDGFFIASEDLRLRGPGDLFGIRQSGLMDFRIGDVFQDYTVLQQVAQAAEKILKEDPGLMKEENYNLRQSVAHYLDRSIDFLTI